MGDRYDEQYVGTVRIGGVDHHITLFPVFPVEGDGKEMEAAPGHSNRLEALRLVERVMGLRPIRVAGRAYLCAITPHAD